jgi:23S rRNA pseudouridine1911/1915/1917 synthase
VHVDALAVAADAVLKRGQTLTWQRPGWEEPAAPGSFEILHEDADVLAVAKPAGLPTLPGAGYLENTLLHRVRAHAADAAPAHRLGRWTSGIVLFGRSSVARASLSAQWAAGTVRKPPPGSRQVRRS